MTQEGASAASTLNAGSRRTVLISAPSLDERVNVSGVASVVREIIDSLRANYEFRHLLLGAAQAKSTRKRIISSVKAIAKGIYLTAFSRYDVFHSNTALNPKSVIRDVVLMALSAARGKTVIWHVHGGLLMTHPPSRVAATMIGKLFSLSSKVVVLSELEKLYLQNTFGVPRSKIIVIKNGTTVSGDRPPRGSGELIKAIFAGRLVPEKGVDLLIDFFRLHGEQFRAHLTVYGSGPMLPLVQASVGTAISYAGVVSQAEMREVLKDFDLLVLPSRNGEGMPMIIVEAMAAGVVPISTSMASIPEIIEDQVTGFLISPNIDALQGVFTVITAEPFDLEVASKAAHSFALRELDAAKNFKALGPIYG